MGRIVYDPEITAYNHAVHYGAGYPYYRGDLVQTGQGLGGTLRGVFRTIQPLLRPLARRVASHITQDRDLRRLAKDALASGIDLGKDIFLDRKPVGESIQRRVAETVNKTLNPQRGGARYRPVHVEDVRPRRGKKRRRYKDTIFD